MVVDIQLAGLQEDVIGKPILPMSWRGVHALDNGPDG